MDEFVRTGAELLALGLLPVWIPLIGAIVGAIADRLVPPTTSPAQRAVEAARARSAEIRALGVPPVRGSRETPRRATTGESPAA
jgi:hypothetical protein